MPWEDIIKDPEFQKQPLDTKMKVANNYFDKNMADDEFHALPQQEKTKVRFKFLQTIPDSPTQPKGEEPSFFAKGGKYDRFMTGVERGAAEPFIGAAQRLGIVSQPDVTAAKAGMEQERTEGGTAGSIGEFGGGVLPYAAIPMGGGAGGFLRRAATSGAAGAAIGASQPTTEKESPTANALVGGVMGAGGQGVMSAAGKFLNGLKGKVPQNTIDALANKFGIRTTLGETTGNAITQKGETILEGVPLVGLKGFREKQQQEAQAAVSKHFSKYVVNPSAGSTAEMKIANDAHLDTLYNNVRQNAKELPLGEAPTVKQSAGELMERYPTVFDSVQDNNVKKILKNISGDVSDVVTKTPAGKILGESGQPLISATTETKTPQFSFDDLWKLRKGLGKEIGDAKTDTARGELSKLYSAVSTDIDSMLSKSKTPALQDFKAANDAFKQYSVKFDVLRQAYDKAVGTTGAGEMFSPKKYSTILKNLANDPKYKKNIKWNEDEVEEMTGLANILQVVKRAGQFKENPPTGNRWGLPALLAGGGEAAYLAGGAATAVKTGGATLGIAGIARILTGTEKGKMLARAASKFEPDSPQMKKVVDQLYQILPKAAAVGTTQDTNKIDRNY